MKGQRQFQDIRCLRSKWIPLPNGPNEDDLRNRLGPRVTIWESLGKFGGKFWKEGGKEEKGRGRGKKRRKGKEARENVKGRGKGKKMSRGLLFVCLFFLLVTFWNHWNLRCTKMEISTRKKAFHTGKKLRNVTLPPLKDIPLTSLYMGIMGKFSNLAHLWLHTWLRPCTQGSCDFQLDQLVCCYLKFTHPL